MFNSIYSYTLLGRVSSLRRWLYLVAAILALCSILNAAHTHDIHDSTEEHCVLCQHHSSSAQITDNSHKQLILTIASAFIAFVFTNVCFSFTSPKPLIRAPPF
jgi:hypothetical protein